MFHRNYHKRIKKHKSCFFSNSIEMHMLQRKINGRQKSTRMTAAQHSLGQWFLTGGEPPQGESTVFQGRTSPFALCNKESLIN